MNRFALVASTALVGALAAPPAAALQEPKPCKATETRVRCVPYDPHEVVEVPAVVGGSTVIELHERERIVDAGVSDNGLLEGGEPVTRRYLPVSGGQGGQATADPNLVLSRRGRFLFIKPLRALVPQSINLVTEDADGKTRPYSLQVRAQPSSMGPEAGDAVYRIRYTYPSEEAASRRAQWDARREAREARAAAARLRQHTISGETVKNREYHGIGSPEARAALAPSAGSGEPAAWDDGHRTYLRYAGNRSLPMVYQTFTDGRPESLVGHNTDADPTTRGKIIVVHGIFPSLKLRDGNLVLCVVNRGWRGGAGSNPGTGTVSPDVVREATPVREDAPHVR